MSVEARLQALVQNYRAQYGDAALAHSPQLIAQLSVQAPDLHGEIKALAAAINRGAAARIAAAADPEGEATKVATEIAGSEKLSMAVATAAVTVARGLGPVGAAPTTPPAAPIPSTGWAGETMVAGASPQTAPPGYPPQAGVPGYLPPGSAPPVPGQPTVAQPIYKNPLAIGGVAVALVLGLLWTQRTPDVERGPTNEQGPVGPRGPGGQGGAAPTLARSGTLPTLSYNRTTDGVVILFMFETGQSPANGVVVLPARGWDSGPTQVAFGRPGANGQIEVMNDGAAQLLRMRGDGGAVARGGPVQWSQDRLNVGPMCVAFQAASGQAPPRDVGLSGSTMCVMDGDCQRSLGCGRIR